jgi:hypothetical protein
MVDRFIKPRSIINKKNGKVIRNQSKNENLKIQDDFGKQA